MTPPFMTSCGKNVKLTPTVKLSAFLTFCGKRVKLGLVLSCCFFDKEGLAKHELRSEYRRKVGGKFALQGKFFLSLFSKQVSIYIPPVYTT
jgi:hypothetical protein